MNQQVSPISQMLYTLGLTREDLSRRSDEMRQFLTVQASPTLRVADRNISRSSSSASHCSDSRPSFARPLSRSCSASLRESSPPITPVKKEPCESSASLRHYDSMEVVIERQRRQSRREKRAKKEKGRDSATQSILPPPPTSPSPSTASHASLNLDSFILSRDDRRVSSGDSESNKDIQDTLPASPHTHMYYREHTRSSPLPEKDGQVYPEAETSITPRSNDDAMPLSHPVNEYRSARYPFRLNGSAEASTSQNPVTPQKRRSLAPSRDLNAHHFPSSSPPLSSPLSSPSRPLVNLVSSPGPMGPLPKEDEYERLPYQLPPGPYSPNKPDLSYAALVGQAILSSTGHRLTLQEIYDWITIVYPHYKRGETTWMNSIRHVLSTTVCFRKVPRDRSVGRTLWAIWDEDLECFKDGGFRKHLCKDIMKAAQTNSKIKGKARKRSDAEEDSALDTRRSKRSKKSLTIPEESRASTSQTSHNAPPLSHPLFPPSRPTPHHQPYYESCILQPQPQSLPAEIIFPPLPPTAYTRFHTAPSETPGLTSTQTSSKESPNVAHADLPSDLPAPPSDASSMLSVPELTPNRSSSSPPPSLPLTSEVDLDDYIHMDQTIQKERTLGDAGQRIVASDGTSEADSSAAETDVGDEALFRGTTLGPVQFWGKAPRSDESMPNRTVRRGDSKVRNQQLLKGTPDFLHSLPTSPTPELRPLKLTSSPRLATPGKGETCSRPQTPPSLSVLKTPPRSATLQISSVRTPLSHKGLHMSPSASLAHYKSNLDPPPVHTYLPDGDDIGEGEESSDSTRTPRRRTTMLAPPVTPKRLTSNAESPFRLPLGGSGTSPFRTPGSKGVFDPHDPSALLDEELNRTAAGQDDSPVGLFGKGRGTLLYDSPGALGSPGKWFKWW